VAGPLRAWLEARGEGLLGLAFGTDDIEACVAALAARGLEPGPVEDGHGRDLGGGDERHWRRAPLPLAATRGVLLFPIQHRSPADGLPLAAPTGSAAASVHALDNAVVRTTDGEAARALFGDALGLRLALDREFADWGVRLLFFRVGGVTVEVAAPLTADAPGSDAGPIGATLAAAIGGSAPVGDALHGLSYRVGDADAARARLGDAGLDVSEVRKGRRPSTRVFTVRSGTFGVPTLMLELESAPR
jgi:catechol 2,3-dioxygenase-like lactoylglutathione lyase family enzyme